MEVIGPDLEARLAKMRDDVKKEVASEFQAAQRNAAADQAIDQFLNANQAAFVMMNPADGRTPMIGLDGRQVLSPRGQAFFQHATTFKNNFKATYGREPERLDVLRHVVTQLQVDEASGKFGPPQQPGMPQQQPVPQGFGMQPGFAPQPPMMQAAATPYGFAPQVPQMPAAPQAPAMPPLAGQSAAAFNPWMAPRAPQFPQQTYAPAGQPGYAPQDTMVARALASQAMYAPQPAGTLVNQQLHQVPQQQTTDLKQLFVQAAQARGMSTDGFYSS